jgi:Holliday junction resolvase RusA-like endonuclease
MKQQTITIVGDLAKLNDHDSANRSNKFMGAALKKRMTDLVALQCGKLKPITGECIVTFNWHFSSRHDFDNIKFACKYVLDGMVKSGKLPNDNQKYIVGFGGDWFTKVEKGEEKVIVEIEETER